MKQSFRFPAKDIRAEARKLKTGYREFTKDIGKPDNTPSELAQSRVRASETLQERAYWLAVHQVLTSPDFRSGETIEIEIEDTGPVFPPMPGEDIPI